MNGPHERNSFMDSDPLKPFKDSDPMNPDPMNHDAPQAAWRRPLRLSHAPRGLTRTVTAH